MKTSSVRQKNKGFGLVGLLIALAIVGMLIAFQFKTARKQDSALAKQLQELKVLKPGEAAPSTPEGVAKAVESAIKNDLEQSSHRFEKGVEDSNQ